MKTSSIIGIALTLAAAGGITVKTLVTKPTGTQYYVSFSGGSDANNGTSTGTPFKTISKVNSLNLAAGDIVSFKKGDVWEGSTLVVNHNGSSGNVITYNSYGTGDMPIISGLTTVSSWTSIGSGRYTATLSGGQSTLNMVTVDGSFQRVSREPEGNTDYYNITGISGTGPVTFTSASTSTNNPNNFTGAPTSGLTGGQVVCRSQPWSLWVLTVTGQTTTTVTATPLAATSGGTFEVPATGMGFFLQNAPVLCDNFGEWAYNGSTHLVTMYFGAEDPATHTIQAANTTALVTCSGHSFVTFDGLDFRGANNDNFDLPSSNHISIINGNISLAGIMGVFGNATTSANLIQNNTFSWINSIAIRIPNGGSAWKIDGNTMDHIASISGMGGIGEGQYFGIKVDNAPGNGANDTIINNRITTTGYIPIMFNGPGNLVQNNYIDTFGTIKDDVAGIYCDIQDQSGSLIDANIVLNGIGCPQGTNHTDYRAFGIYVDDAAHNLEISNNSIAYMGRAGIYIHNGHEINIHDNTMFDNHEAGAEYYNDGSTIANITYTTNASVAKGTTELTFSSGGGTEAKGYFSTLDNNYYERPANDNNSIQTAVPSKAYNLAAWQTYSGKDAHSKASPFVLTDLTKYRFEYNASSSPSSVSLGGNTYADHTGALHSGTLSVPAFRSFVLYQTTSTNNPPVAIAGNDITITLPTSSVTMAGNGTDADGTIASYAWTKISGPATFTITTPSSKTTTITGLVQGVYQFQLTVTDNLGATATDVMQVTVNAGANTAPTANAGSDKAITLPTSTTTLTGSGSDADGSITKYNWTVVSGPVTPTIVTPTQATTVVNNLGVSGTYVLQLTVTDNLGATGSDNVNIVVSAPANTPPVVSAGASQNITLPTTSATLTGSASDPGGSIASVAWTTVSIPTGASTPTIVSATSTTTSVTGLSTAGSYTFKLTATDNLGATNFSTVVVLVNPAANVNPTVNAGSDVSITLPTNTVTVTATASDADGTIKSYTWSEFSGPSTFTIVNPTQAKTVINNLVQGIYNFNVRVTDNSTGFATDMVQVTVNAPANIPPVVTPGPDQTITQPTSSVTLAGGATDPDGSISSHTWSFVSGPSTPTITASSSYTSTVTGLTSVGSYTLKLSATDNGSATSTATMTVKVAAANTPPTVSAGVDQIDSLPTDITLNGTATDADGTIKSLGWTQISGPNASTIRTPTQAKTTVTNLVEGVYLFKFTGIDNSNASVSDTVQITMIRQTAHPQPTPPTASAGPNLEAFICIFCGPASITVTGTPTAGTYPIDSVIWSKVSGPTATITSPNSNTTTITGLKSGTYVFKFRVVDEKGLSAEATMRVLVVYRGLWTRQRFIIVNG